ncbi:MAG: SDR family NAD(P)-dependent oxidoreductase [Sphingomonadales bacterium]|nr:MAG: SDR family NAD(P)-dependent oxidoreductase [Sphingomonadales bacterium]
MGKVIVTGGLGVLGRAVVTELRARGHKVAAIDLAQGESDADAVIGGVDLTSETAVAAAYATAAATLGGVDGLVNVAGGFTWEPVETGSAESWDAMYRINLRTVAVSSRAVLAHLKAGAIVNVGAAAAASPGMGMAPYAASKAGVMALTESLAEELRDRGIRVNAVLPTIIDTPTNRKDMPDADTSGWVTPKGAACVVAFLLSEDSAAVTGAGIRLSLGTRSA